MNGELKNELPRHVALIMDGNRRWAQKRRLPVIEGHRKGAETIRKIIRHLASRGVHTITIWIFSTENWHREQEQVSSLMKLFEEFAGAYLGDAQKEGMRIIHLGRKDRISENLRKKIAEFENETKQFTDNVLNIALDYGGRDDILRAIAKIADAGVNVKTLVEANINAYLDTATQPYPNPDMIIRTGGEQRSSGFMLWQAAYTEYFFTGTLLPDLTPDIVDDLLEQYATRQRRFGA